MWNEHRAERVRRELAERARAPLSSTQLLEEASALVHRVVPVDSSCWATFDPATTMITSTVAYALDQDARALDRFLELEYVRPGPLAFRSLKAERHAVAVLGEHASHAPEVVEERRRDHLAPMGFEHELRWVLGSGAAAWGGVGMMRAGSTVPRSSCSSAASWRARRPTGAHCSTRLRASTAAHPGSRWSFGRWRGRRAQVRR
jgi:hypothetical protein